MQLNDYQFVYVPKHEVLNSVGYYFTTDNKLYSIKTNRIIKKRVKGYSVGYTIAGKFITTKKIKLKPVPKKSKNNLR